MHSCVSKLHAKSMSHFPGQLISVVVPFVNHKSMEGCQRCQRSQRSQHPGPVQMDQLVQMMGRLDRPGQSSPQLCRAILYMNLSSLCADMFRYVLMCCLRRLRFITVKSLQVVLIKLVTLSKETNS